MVGRYVVAGSREWRARTRGREKEEKIEDGDGEEETQRDTNAGSWDEGSKNSLGGGVPGRRSKAENVPM